MPIQALLKKVFSRKQAAPKEAAPEKACHKAEFGYERSEALNELGKDLGPNASVVNGQIRFTVSPETFAWIQERLNAPPEPNERLQRLMKTPSPW